MGSLSSLGIGLSLVFGFLLFALVAEFYYLLWWKKRVANTDAEDDHIGSARKLCYLFCWKKPSSLSSSTALNPQEICTSVRVADNYLIRPFGENEESMEAELMRLHNLSGPPRFLFTINEETKEDLESEDGRSRDKNRKGSGGKRLGDLLQSSQSPFLTPRSSPNFLTSPRTPLASYNQQGFNPLFESSREDEVNRIRSSPPPKFKFLLDAEEKLFKKTLMEEALRASRNGGSVKENLMKVPPPVASASPRIGSEIEEGSFITIFIGKSKEKGHQHQHSSSSQVIPLSSSPSKKYTCS